MMLSLLLKKLESYRANSVVPLAIASHEFKEKQPHGRS